MLMSAKTLLGFDFVIICVWKSSAIIVAMPCSKNLRNKVYATSHKCGE